MEFVVGFLKIFLVQFSTDLLQCTVMFNTRENVLHFFSNGMSITAADGLLSGIIEAFSSGISG